VETVSRDALEWSLTHVERYGDADFFPLPFEYKAIRHCWDGIRDKLLAMNLEEYRPHSARRLPVPKPSGDFRIVAQLDPIDALLYAALVYETCSEVEASRIAEDRHVACSYRLHPAADGALFATKTGWPEFHAKSQSLAAAYTNGYVLLTDITDFYNQASHHRVENALELAGVPIARAKILETFLTALAAKHSRGLPVGSTASNVLAEACLNDVDAFLLRRGVVHTRYVDDFRIYCETRNKAVWTLHELSDYLYTAHRMTLNSSKTRILTCNDFLARELLDPEEEEERGKLSHLQGLILEVFEVFAHYGEIGPEITVEELIGTKEGDKAIRDNIAELFRESLDLDSLNLGITRHLLRRAGSLRTNVIVRQVMENLTKLAPVLRDVAIYLKTTKSVSKKYGKQLLRFLEEDAFGVLPFARLWGLEIIDVVDGIVTNDEAMRIAELLPQGLAVRSAALIARKAGFVDWVRERKETWANFGPWDRRAVILSSSALPRDERNAWLSVVEESGDMLDVAVAKHVRAVR
jgi:Reverse transcriptase (RNA-dependent DNA polymerase)